MYLTVVTQALFSLKCFGLWTETSLLEVWLSHYAFNSWASHFILIESHFPYIGYSWDTCFWSFSSEVDPEFQRLKEEHLVKMASLRQETELLKQQAEVEKMRKQLKELRGETIIPLEGNRKVCTCSFQVNSLDSQQLYCLRILQDVRIARVSLTNFARVAVN